MQDVHDVEENGGLRLAGIATPHPTGRVRFFVEGHRSRRRRETGVSLPTTRASARSGSIGRISNSSPQASVGLCAMIATARSEEHTSELQSLMRISYAVFCLKKKNKEYDIYRLQRQNDK